MAKKEINIDINVNDTSVKNLKTQLKEAKQEALLLAAQPLVDEAALNKAIRKTAELTDNMRDVNEQINVMAGGSVFEQMSNSISDIGGKIASLDFGGASESAKKLLTLSKTITFGDAIKGIKDMGSTFISLGKALLTNPLFLLAAVLVALGFAIYKLLDSLGLIKIAMELIGDAVDAVVQLFKDFTDWIGITHNAANKLAEDQIKNATEVGDAIQKQWDIDIRMAKAAGENTFEREQEKRREAVRTQIEIVNALQAISNAGKELSEEQVKQQQEANDKIKSLNLDGKEAKIRNDKEILDNDIKTQEELDKKNKAAYEKRLAREKKAEEDRQKILKDAQDKEDAQFVLFQELTLSKTEFEIQELIRGYDKKFELANGNAELEKELALKQATDIQLIKDEAAKVELDKKLEQGIALSELKLELAELNLGQLDENASAEEITAYYEQKNALTDEQNALEMEKLSAKYAGNTENNAAYNAELAILSKEHKDNEITNAEEEAEFKKVLLNTQANAVMNTTKSVADAVAAAAGEGSGAAKAAAVASTTISTIQGAQGAFSSLSGIPIVGPALGAVAAAAAVVSGMANVKKILSTPVPKGAKAPSGGGGSTPSIPKVPKADSVAASTPQFNLFGKGNDANTLGSKERDIQNQQMNINVSISESEITNAQNKNKNYKDKVTL